MSSRKGVFFTILSIALYSGLSQANDPFAEMDAEINSSHGNGSAQWQQKRAADAFSDMDKEMRGYSGHSHEAEKKPLVKESVQKAPQPIIIVMPERVIVREVPVKAEPKVAERKAAAPAPVVTKVPVADVAPPGIKKAKSSNKIVRASNYTFELKGCLKSGSEIHCNLLVTSQKQDKKLTLYNSARLFDNLGNEYSPSSAQIANSHTNMRLYHISKQLIMDIPTKVVIKFSGVSNDALSIPKFNIVANSQSTNFNVTYRSFALAVE